MTDIEKLSTEIVEIRGAVRGHIIAMEGLFDRLVELDYVVDRIEEELEMDLEDAEDTDDEFAFVASEEVTEEVWEYLRHVTDLTFSDLIERYPSVVDSTVRGSFELPYEDGCRVRILVCRPQTDADSSGYVEAMFFSPTGNVQGLVRRAEFSGSPFAFSYNGQTYLAELKRRTNEREG